MSSHRRMSRTSGKTESSRKAPCNVGREPNLEACWWKLGSIVSCDGFAAIVHLQVEGCLPFRWSDAKTIKASVGRQENLVIQGLLCRFPRATDAKVCEARLPISGTRGEEGPQRREYWNRGSAARLMHMGNPHDPALLARASRRYRGVGEADGTTSVRSVRNGGAPRAGTDASRVRTLGSAVKQSKH